MKYSQIQPKDGLVVSFGDGKIPEETELPATDRIKPHTGVLVLCNCQRKIFLPHAILDNPEGGTIVLVPKKCKCGFRITEDEANRRLMWAHGAVMAIRYEEIQE